MPALTPIYDAWIKNGVFIISDGIESTYRVHSKMEGEKLSTVEEAF